MLLKGKIVQDLAGLLNSGIPSIETNKLVLTTDSSIITGVPISDGEKLNNQMYEALKSTLPKALESESEAFAKSLENTKMEKSVVDSIKFDLTNSQDDFVYLKDVVIMSMATLKQASLPFLIIDTHQIIGMTIGDYSAD